MTVKGALSLTNNQYQEAVKKAVRPKFRGNRPLPAKTIPQYPQSAEREYRRIAGAYMRLLNEELKRLDPDGLLPETDARVRVRKAARDRRYEMECALKDFDAQDWK